MQIINKIKCYDIDDSVLITPAMAKELLSSNRCIKKLDISRIQKIESDLLNNNFKFNGSTIVLDDEGNLIDGRLRLTACINTGISFRTLIVYGVSSQGQYTKDTGRARNVVQVIAKNGYKNPKALYQCALILNGILTSDVDDNDGIKEKYEHNVSNNEILDIIKSTPNLDVSVDLIMKTKNQYITTAIYHLMVFDYLCRFIDNKPDLANEYLNVLSNKIPADNTHPVAMLRNILTNTLYNTRAEMPKRKQIALMIKAYNLLKQNLRCTSLHWIESKNIPKLYMMTGN